jgi:hypothetical protein
MNKDNIVKDIKIIFEYWEFPPNDFNYELEIKNNSLYIQGIKIGNINDIEQIEDDNNSLKIHLKDNIIDVIVDWVQQSNYSAIAWISNIYDNKNKIVLYKDTELFDKIK